MPMLTHFIMPLNQLSDLKGTSISETTAIVARIDGILARIETGLARKAAENARLQRVEAAAVSALADLDAMLGDGGETDDTMVDVTPERRAG